MNGSDCVVSTHDLTKHFPGGILAVREAELRIPRGAIFGLMGRNGAGKTTLIKMILGLLNPTRGSADLLGCDMRHAPAEHRARVAYVSQRQQLYSWMTVGEILHYVSHFYPTWQRGIVDQLRDSFGIDNGRKIGTLSGGQQRQVSIILALASGAEVLVLDEPAAELDPVARRCLIDALVDIVTGENGQTVIFSTHIISDLERIADHVGFMDKGRLSGMSELQELQESFRKVQIIFEEPPPEVLDLPGAINVVREGRVVTAAMRIKSEADLEELRIRYIPSRVSSFPLGLEDIFIEMFKGDRN